VRLREKSKQSSSGLAFAARAPSERRPNTFSMKAITEVWSKACELMWPGFE
jgi:hypothetical protein